MDVTETYCTDISKWRFTYEGETQLAWLNHYDGLPSERYPVIDGIAFICGMPMVQSVYEEDDMSMWLTLCWKRVYSQCKYAQFYLGRDTERIATGAHGLLTNNYCPLCLKQREEFEVHHVIFRSDGGGDSASNLLRICRSCHALINFGCRSDGAPRQMAAVAHQLHYFGLNFVLGTPPQSGKYQDINPLEALPYLQKVLAAYNQLSHMRGVKQTEGDLCFFWQLMYKYFVGVIQGDFANYYTTTPSYDCL